MPRSSVVCFDIDNIEYEVPVSELNWRPSAYGIVIKDEEILVSKHYGKYYFLPGGGLDFGELPEAAVVREVKEETGIDATNPRLVSVHSDFFKLPFPDKGIEFIQSILMYYRCDYVGGELSVAGFDIHEKEYAEKAEWLSIEKINTIQVPDRLDWRPLVIRALGSK